MSLRDIAQMLFIAALFALAVAWALAAPVYPQSFDAEQQQAIFARMQAEIAKLEQQRTDLDYLLGQRKEQLSLLQAVLQTNAQLAQRLRQLQPTPTATMAVEP